MRDAMVWATLKMILALGMIGALLFGLMRLSKRMEWGRRNALGDHGIRVLTSKLIAPQRYVSLVEIGEEVLALGISPQQITFLTKIENKETLKSSLLETSVGPESPSWLKGWSGRQKSFRIGSLRMGNGK
ncbi:MAG: flagellar biosynthetic protein FliO [Deltaproteobacteria bacterium]|nr:flagellar biosynthetic protein FliO [Deltaproteobacteria bacterium]